MPITKTQKVVDEQHRAERAAEQAAEAEQARFTEWKTVVLRQAGEIAAKNQLWWLDDIRCSGYQTVRRLRDDIVRSMIYGGFLEDRVGSLDYSANNYLIEAIYLLNGNITPWLARRRSMNGEWSGVPIVVSEEFMALEGDEPDNVENRNKVAGQVRDYALEWFGENGYPIVTNFTDKHGKLHKHTVVLPKP